MKSNLSQDIISFSLKNRIPREKKGWLGHGLLATCLLRMYILSHLFCHFLVSVQYRFSTRQCLLSGIENVLLWRREFARFGNLWHGGRSANRLFWTASSKFATTPHYGLVFRPISWSWMSRSTWRCFDQRCKRRKRWQEGENTFETSDSSESLWMCWICEKSSSFHVTL